MLVFRAFSENRGFVVFKVVLVIFLGLLGVLPRDRIHELVNFTRCLHVIVGDKISGGFCNNIFNFHIIIYPLRVLLCKIN